MKNLLKTLGVKVLVHMMAFNVTRSLISSTVEPQSYEPPGKRGVHKSEMSVTLKSSTSLKILRCSPIFMKNMQL